MSLKKINSPIYRTNMGYINMRFLFSSFYNFIKKIFKRSETKQTSDLEEKDDHGIEPDQIEADENVSGKITIFWEGVTGDFSLYIEPIDETAESAEVLALLLHSCNAGDMSYYFLKALQSWCETSVERSQYVGRVLELWKTLEEHSDTDELAIHPSDVFNFKESTRNDHS